MVLYGCAAWASTESITQQLLCAQQAMLRSMVGYKRRKNPTGEMEDWICGLKRTTATAEASLQELGFKPWPVEAYAHKWRWLGLLLRRRDNHTYTIHARKPNTTNAETSPIRSDSLCKPWCSAIQSNSMDSSNPES